MLKEIPKSILTSIFGNLTKKIIEKHNVKIVAVTGSVGKTSTKLAIAQVLSEKYKVGFQKGNYNTLLSVPFIFLDQPQPNPFDISKWVKAYLSGRRILKQATYYDVVVVELGADRPRDVIAFNEYLNPDVSVVTAVSPEHMAQFQTIDAVAAEELSVSKFSKNIILNSDDISPEFITKYIGGTKYLTYGLKPDANYSGTYKISNNEMEVTIKNAGNSFNAQTALFGAPFAKAITAAAAVSGQMDLSNDEIKAGIKKIMPNPGRMNILKGIKNSMIIDDTYNSSPLAVKAALEVLNNLKAPQRIVVLGMMNELGESSKKEHQTMGELCTPESIDLVITLGEHANFYTAPAAAAKGCKVIETSTPQTAARAVKENLKDSGIVLVKGSQNGVYAEEVVKKLLLNSEDAVNLVRQSGYWMKIKIKQFGDIL
jgi:UDP-N-acetylmuramoyl-tripeptide--D-alanyl-D-alanine ligase